MRPKLQKKSAYPKYPEGHPGGTIGALKFVSRIFASRLIGMRNYPAKQGNRTLITRMKNRQSFVQTFYEKYYILKMKKSFCRLAFNYKESFKNITERPIEVK